jgi:hypothetical protein
LDRSTDRVRDAIAVGVAQQRDAIGARHRAASFLLKAFEEPALHALAVLGPRRCIGLGDEHIAIREHVQPARVIEIAGEGLDPQAFGGCWRLSCRPSLRVYDVHFGQ